MSKPLASKPKSATERLPQLDGLRGIAMLFVFLGHFCSIWAELPHAKGAPDIFLKIVEADATFGSSCFMLLSALFTYGSFMRNKRGFGSFFTRRLQRLYPLYFLLTFVYIVGCFLVPRMSKIPAGPGEAAAYLIGTLLVLPGFMHARPLMDASWTLSFILLFYGIAAGLARAFTFFRLSRLQRFAFLAVAGFLWAMTGTKTGWWEARTAIFWTGMALSEAIGAFSGDRLAAVRLALPAGLLAVAGVAVRTWLILEQPQVGPVPLLVWRFIATSIALSAFLWVACFGPEWWKKLLARPRLLQLGETSYAFYLTHGFALKIFRFGIFPMLGAAVKTQPVFWVSQITGMVLSIYFARLAYVLVEVPMARLCNQWFRSREEKPVLIYGPLPGSAPLFGNSSVEIAD